MGISRIDCPRVNIDRNLMNRMLRKVREKYSGKDPDSMAKFIDFGNEVKCLGGIFKYKICPSSTKIIQVHMQQKIEKELVDQYGKHLFFMDTTANTTKYSFRNSPAVGIDCFGKLCLMGTSLIEVEDHTSI